MIVTISKGQQLTIPYEYRRNLNLKAGSRVELNKKGKCIIITPIEENLNTLFEQARKIKPKHGLKARQMDEMIEHEIHR